MINEISILKIKIENHLKNLESDERYKFFKEKGETLLIARLFLMLNSIERISGLLNHHLKQVYTSYTEIEKILQELVNVH